jgi:hypothetical protein
MSQLKTTYIFVSFPARVFNLSRIRVNESVHPSVSTCVSTLSGELQFGSCRSPVSPTLREAETELCQILKNDSTYSK